MEKKVLVIAAHPDDEILGCGGTLAKHVNNNDIVDVLLLGGGIKSRQLDYTLEIEELESLKNMAIAANKSLGVRNVYFEDFPDNEFDSVSILTVIKKIEEYVGKFNPEVIYTHHFSDLNIDHTRISEAVLTATRPIPCQTVKKILFFEIASSTNWSFGLKKSSFEPNYFINISKFLDLKLKALEFYKSEMREYPHSRSIKSIEALSRWRGASAGFNAAEAFVLARIIED